MHPKITLRAFAGPLWLFAALFLAPWAVSAQSSDFGAVEGRVVEKGSGIPLPGANVFLRGGIIGVTTAIDGTFRLERLEPGSYIIAASLIGFSEMDREIEIRGGETETLTFELAEVPIRLSEIVARGDRAYSAASSVTVRAYDLATRPATSSQELLRLAPGLVIAQHAGGGKAEQIFLRGFDADHGTDVALAVDGVPVNMVSHGHGQGYADLHFVIPDVVEELDVRKGPYFADYGNLATAGAVGLRTRDHFDKSYVRAEVGSFESARITSVVQVPLTGTHQGAYLAGQFYSTEGAVDSPQEFRRANVFGKFHTHLSEDAKIALTVSGFNSAWNASGQIPQRAIDSGQITRFGAIDDLEGGTTSRNDLNLMYEASGTSGRRLRLQTYASRYTFKLFSNFTFFLNNPDAGDMIEQLDDRVMMGLNTDYRFISSLPFALTTTTIGGGVRADRIDVQLWRSPDRNRLAPRVDTFIRESNLNMWAVHELIFNTRFRIQLGLRGDYLTFDVDDHLEGVDNGLAHASGYAQEFVLSPKFNAVWTLSPSMDLFFNSGKGFHSNDARNVVQIARAATVRKSLERRGVAEDDIVADLESQYLPVTTGDAATIPAAFGAEIGGRFKIGRTAYLSTALWALDLEREFVYVGDEGIVELSGATRRIGLDVEGRLEPAPWLSVYGDVSFS
ncbi:MAG: TonB-dependent receptor, partial [Rhodothermales bacterium]|nr:TonB-dependent receptor [Rhodothermales bacterium]